MTALLLAATAFVATHFLLSYPLRAPLVAAATLGWTVVAFRAAPATPLWWPVGDAIWAATLVMLLASVLLMGSLVGNPALPAGGAPAKAPGEARGGFAITRHPMLWSFALWGVCHIAVMPTEANAVLAGAIILLSLIGATAQDRKKEALQAAVWPAWEAGTSYWPFAAIVSSRVRPGGFGGHALGGGLLVWLAATWAHMPLAGRAAGAWRWV